MVPSMAFCNYEEIIVAKLGKFFCNFVRFYYAINTKGAAMKGIPMDRIKETFAGKGYVILE